MTKQALSYENKKPDTFRLPRAFLLLALAAFAGWGNPARAADLIAPDTLIVSGVHKNEFTVSLQSAKKPDISVSAAHGSVKVSRKTVQAKNNIYTFSLQYQPDKNATPAEAKKAFDQITLQVTEKGVAKRKFRTSKSDAATGETLSETHIIKVEFTPPPPPKAEPKIETAATQPATATELAGSENAAVQIPVAPPPAPVTESGGGESGSTNRISTVSQPNNSGGGAPMPGALSVAPNSDLISIGTAGGPFEPDTLSYTLANVGGLPIDWTAIKGQTWVSVSASGGTLAPGEDTVVTVSINAQADNLAVSSTPYSDTVAFANTTNGNGNTSHNVGLIVNTPPEGALSVVETATLAAGGPPGGPFAPASIRYTLKNTGGQPLDWTAADGTWLSASPAGGALAPHAQTFVTVSINNQADTLAAASTPYSDSVAFTNATNGVGDATRSASLFVTTAPVITADPADQTVTAGQRANFNVSATGANLSYQWKRNGIALTGATSATYSTPNTTAADNGAQFTVTVSNPGGTVTSSAAALTVNVPPSIATQPANATVNINQGASFSVAATGTAPLHYQWKHGSSNVGTDSPSYAIASAQTADAGAYTVTVTNVAGSVTSSAAGLVVVTPPVILAGPADKTVNQGQAAGFSVTASGLNLSYQWKKNGGNISGATAASYTTPNTTAADNGAVFTVTVSNGAGSVTSGPATLTVNIPPSITAQPANATVNVGQPANFSVTATGIGVSYQWRKNGAPIAGATASGYATPNTVAADNNAQFTVIVSNVAGSVTSSAATLTVVTPPLITAQPASRTVNAGQTAAFSVTATGPNLSYQWQKNGTNISGATAASYTTPVTAAADDGAQFTVIVSNSAGSVTSSAATLTVVIPPVITAQPAAQTVTAGQTAGFSVTATGLNLSYQWKKNGANISGATAASYTTPATAAADNGASYTVSVSNGAGSVTSAAALLTVNSPPAITAQPQNATVNVNQPASFSVAATGTAPLHYQWKKGAANVGTDSPSYSIASAQTADSGSYSVTVTNTYGSAASNAATLTVTDAPIITAQPASVTVNAGQTAAFSVTGTGTGLSYQWKKNGANISGATSASYTTPNTVTADNGAQFTVTVSNAAGAVTSNAAILTVNAAQPPGFTYWPNPLSLSIPQGGGSINNPVNVDDSAIANSDTYNLTASVQSAPAGWSVSLSNVTNSHRAGSHAPAWLYFFLNVTTASGVAQGSYTVTLSVTNPVTGGTASIPVSVTVTAAGTGGSGWQLPTHAAPIAMYVDRQLTADCTTTGNYSINARSCTGSDGYAVRGLQTAASAGLRPDDTVAVRGGTYGHANQAPFITGAANQITPLLNITVSGAAGHPIRFVNYPGEFPIIDLENTDHKAAVFISGSHVEFNGFEITNSGARANYVSDGLVVGLTTGNTEAATSGIALKNLKVHEFHGVNNANQAGIHIRGNADRGIIQYVETYNNGIGFYFGNDLHVHTPTPVGPTHWDVSYVYVHDIIDFAENSDGFIVGPGTNDCRFSHGVTTDSYDGFVAQGPLYDNLIVNWTSFKNGGEFGYCTNPTGSHTCTDTSNGDVDGNGFKVGNVNAGEANPSLILSDQGVAPNTFFGGVNNVLRNNLSFNNGKGLALPGVVTSGGRGFEDPGDSQAHGGKETLFMNNTAFDNQMYGFMLNGLNASLYNNIGYKDGLSPVGGPGGGRSASGEWAASAGALLQSLFNSWLAPVIQPRFAFEALYPGLTYPLFAPSILHPLAVYPLAADTNLYLDAAARTPNPHFGVVDGLKLQPGSPAIDAGTFFAVTTGAGSGTVIAVNKKPYPYFQIGDKIQIENASPSRATVTALDNAAKTVTVNTAVSFGGGAGVHTPWYGAKPDLGAYEYCATPDPDACP